MRSSERMRKRKREIKGLSLSRLDWQSGSIVLVDRWTSECGESKGESGEERSIRNSVRGEQIDGS